MGSFRVKDYFARFIREYIEIQKLLFIKQLAWILCCARGAAGRILHVMASDAPASASSKPDSVGFDSGTHRLQASQARNFFLRVGHANGALSDLMKSSAITLAESQKLLAEVDALLRR